MDNKFNFLSVAILRGFSAILIVLYHYTYRYNENLFIVQSNATFEWPFRLWWGAGAVTTFFLISGFLVSKLICSEQYHLSKSITYATNRFFRLYPTYWNGVIITSLILFFLMDEAVVSVQDFLLNLTMLPSVFNAQSVDGAYWTMQLEFFFSVIVIFMLLFPYSWRKHLFLPFWIISTIIYNYIGIDSNELIWKLFRLLFMPKFSGCFVAGISLYQMVFNVKEKKYFSCLLVCAILNQIIQMDFNPGMVFFFTTIVILGLIRKIDNILADAKSIFINYFTYCIIWIASISYPLYLVHQMIGFSILKKLNSLGIQSEFVILIPLCISIIIAYLMHRFIELPTGRIGKEISHKLAK